MNSRVIHCCSSGSSKSCIELGGFLTLVTWRHLSRPFEHTGERTRTATRNMHLSRGMHTSKHAHSSTSVFSHISPGIPTPSLGARNDLGLFPLTNAYLHCSQMRGCREGSMRHLKQTEETGRCGDTSCSTSFVSGAVKTDKSLLLWRLHHQAQEIKCPLPW